MKHKKAIEFLKKVFPKVGYITINSDKLDQVCFTYYDPEVEEVWKMIDDYEECCKIIDELETKGLISKQEA